MRPKSGLPKRKAIRSMPIYEGGLKDHCNLDTKADGRYTVISLFSGCGGLDLGFLGGFQYLDHTYSALPFEILEAHDFNQKAIETYRLNIGDRAHVTDLTKINLRDLPEAEVLIGGFPCQDFSSSGTKQGLSGSRGQLYKVMSSYMRLHKPKIVIAENVPHLSRLAKGEYLKTILKEFEEAGYNFNIWDLYAPDYGISQSRRRLIFFGLRKDFGEPLDPPVPTHEKAHRPIDYALHNLVNITDESVTNQSQYFVATRATSGGGQGDHTNERGKVAYCIRANAKARIQFHYELDRRLTVRECARLQTFPDKFVFPFSAMINMEQIGNAVPPVLAHFVAKRVKEALDQIALTGRVAMTDQQDGSQIELFPRQKYA